MENINRMKEGGVITIYIRRAIRMENIMFGLKLFSDIRSFSNRDSFYSHDIDPKHYLK